MEYEFSLRLMLLESIMPLHQANQCSIKYTDLIMVFKAIIFVGDLKQVLIKRNVQTTGISVIYKQSGVA